VVPKNDAWLGSAVGPVPAIETVVQLRIIASGIDAAGTGTAAEGAMR
jgi:hypothetical protein